ncbi:monovalent cation/H+ antiporter subunit D family protein [uncultured Clostridium sp.]|uniref:monovalent cation/H+ antiporter subunit D family protein n=1 Tax=uncultured Clostridium sp. TaxID=59620 RepID=UPI0028E85B04|nr:monovalent cation/H+ antiporter subunit D family protein [uncultured Clostridium sp.]
MNNIIVLLPIIFPFIAAILIWLCNFNRRKRNVFVFIITSLNFIFVYIIFKYFNKEKIHLFVFNEFLDIYFKIDKLTILFATLVSILWIFTTIYAMEYMKHEGKENRFFSFFLTTLGVTLGIAFSGNLITLYLFYELLTLATFPLVIHSDTKEALNSGRKYLIYSFAGATLVLFGMIILFNLTKDLSFLPKGIINNLSNENIKLYNISFITMFLGFSVKAALVPFHSWLPQAMVAPTPVSSLLHAVAVVKSGVFALVRTVYYIYGAEFTRNNVSTKYLTMFIIISILMGSFLALHQENLKKRLAYSTISQLGYILLGIILVNRNAFVGAMLHLINHAVIKITLFFCVGAIMYTRGKTEISQIKGIGREMPITLWCFTISSISLIGIPPTNGFVSKWFLAQGSLGAGKILFPAILLFSALLTSMYLLPIITEAFFKREKGNAHITSEAPRKMLIPIICITTITVILGLFPNPVLSFIQEIAKELM